MQSISMPGQRGATRRQPATTASTPALKLASVRPLLDAPIGMMRAHAEWAGDEVVIERIALLADDPAADALRVEYDHDDERYAIIVPILRTPQHLGGKRPWFGCPRCLRRCATLFRPRGEPAPACRRCMGLVYEAQLGREHRLRRAQRIVRECETQLRRSRLRAATRRRLGARRNAARLEIAEIHARIVASVARLAAG